MPYTPPKFTPKILKRHFSLQSKMERLMNKVNVCLSLAILVTSAFGAGVTVTSPTSGATVQSPVHFVASATTSCSKGIASIGIYTAPFQLAYVVNGASLDTNLTMSAGDYNTVVQEWDNCGG